MHGDSLPPLAANSGRKTKIEIDAGTATDIAVSFKESRLPTLAEIGHYRGDLLRDVEYLDAEIQRLW